MPSLGNENPQSQSLQGFSDNAALQKFFSSRNHHVAVLALVGNSTTLLLVCFEFVSLGLWESPLRAELGSQMAAKSFLQGNQEKKDWIVEASVASGSSIP